MSAPPEPDAPQPSERALHAFLIQVAELLHAYGTPVHRLERVMENFARGLGVRAQFLATPTSLFASFGEGDAKQTHLLRVGTGEVDLGKLVEFDEVMEDVDDGRLVLADAPARLRAVAEAPSRWSPPAKALAYGAVSAAAACFLGGGTAELAWSFALGVGILLLARLFQRSTQEIGVLEPLGAFLVAFTALVAARTLTPMDDRLVTVSGLIVLLPGLTMTTGLIELTTRHLVSGMARLAGALAIFLTLLLGVALAWRVGDLLLPPGPAPELAGLPGWTEWAALAAAPFAFAVLLEARVRELGPIFVTGVLGYLASRWGVTSLGTELGPFLGALAVGLASNLYARLVDRPSLVPMTPGILLLVPGSLGFLSLTSFLHREALAGMEWAFRCGLVAVSLVGGLMVSNLVLPPRRVL